MFLGVALILLAIIFVATLANKWQMPLVVVSLLSGMIFGSDVLNVMDFSDYVSAQRIADFALVFVLFIGGYGTKWERLKVVFAPSMILATFGVMITAAVIAASLHLLPFLNFSLQSAILIGCIIASTDAAAVFSILRSRSLDPQMSSLVEIESATNDPMAIVLTTIAVQLAVVQTSAQISMDWEIARQLLWQITGGLGIGLAIGYCAVLSSKIVAHLDKGYFYIFIIAIIMLSFGVADFAKASGILSAFFAGFVLGNSNIPYKSNSTTLLEALSTIGNVVIFVLLGLLVSPREFGGVYKDGIMLFLILAFVARPIAVLLCTFYARFPPRKTVFLCWSGLRGAVPIVLATYPAAAGIAGSEYIFNLVFFTVLLSMVIQGGTIIKLADFLKLATKAKPKPKQAMELVAMHNSGMELIEIDIDDEIYSGSTMVSEFNFCDKTETTITMVNRNDKIIAPRGDTQIFAGDMLYVLTEISEAENVTAQILSHFKTVETEDE